MDSTSTGVLDQLSRTASVHAGAPPVPMIALHDLDRYIDARIEARLAEQEAASRQVILRRSARRAGRPEPLLVELESAAALTGVRLGTVRSGVDRNDWPVINLVANIPGRERRMLFVPVVWCTKRSWPAMEPGETRRSDISLARWPAQMTETVAGAALSCSRTPIRALLAAGQIKFGRDENGHRVISREDLEEFVWRLIRQHELMREAAQG